MGLDATIYLDADRDQRLMSLRIGHISTVAHLRNCLRAITPDSPTLQTKVLYSGSHCGDELNLEDIKNALEEIQRVNLNTISDEDLRAFLQTFGELLQTALSRGLPVVF